MEIGTSKEDCDYYALDRIHPSLILLPKAEYCKLCKCHRDAHLIYHFIPLLSGYLCVACCREEVTMLENFPKLQEILPNITPEEIQSMCKKCGKA